MLRSNDVHCTPVILSTPEQTPTHRLGSYYLENGFGVRASKVTYDRKNSAITEFDFDTVKLDEILEGYTWLHLSGITLALSKFTFNILDRVGGGDANITGDASTIRNLMNMNYDIKR